MRDTINKQAGEIQRLRAALEYIAGYKKGEALVYVTEIKRIAAEALSTSTEPAGAKNPHEWESDFSRSEYVCRKCRGTYWTISGGWDGECPATDKDSES